MDTTRNTNMKNGLISLLTVVIVISLATAAVLAVSTSHAMEALSARQATMTKEGYAAEKSAQILLALLDDEIKDAADEGENVITRTKSRINEILVNAVQEGVSAAWDLVDDELTCTFTTVSGRMLECTIRLDRAGGYDIESWRLTAQPDQTQTQDQLWSGF